MLTAKEAKLNIEIQTVEREIRALSKANKKTEVEVKLRKRIALKKRIGIAKSMLNNMQMMKFEIEDSKLYTYSIGAMSDMARQYNHSGVNLDAMYNKLTSAQDTFAEFANMNDDMQAVMSDGFGSTAANANDDDLRRELDEILDMDVEELSAPPSVHLLESRSSNAFIDRLPSVPVSTPAPQPAAAQSTIEAMRSKYGMATKIATD